MHPKPKQLQTKRLLLGVLRGSLLQAVSCAISRLFTWAGGWGHYCPSGWLCWLFTLCSRCHTYCHCFDLQPDSTPLTAAALLPALEFLSLLFLCFTALHTETPLQGELLVSFMQCVLFLRVNPILILYSLSQASITTLLLILAVSQTQQPSLPCCSISLSLTDSLLQRRALKAQSARSWSYHLWPPSAKYAHCSYCKSEWKRTVGTHPVCHAMPPVSQCYMRSTEPPKYKLITKLRINYIQEKCLCTFSLSDLSI